MWCGFDNDAPDDRAVSPIYPNVDRCCRDHDHCPTFIPRGECLDGICNHSYLVPIMDCQCEEEFQKCLREVPKSRARNRELLPDEGTQSVPKDEKAGLQGPLFLGIYFYVHAGKDAPFRGHFL